MKHLCTTLVLYIALFQPLCAQWFTRTLGTNDLTSVAANSTGTAIIGGLNGSLYKSINYGGIWATETATAGKNHRTLIATGSIFFGGGDNQFFRYSSTNYVPTALPQRLDGSFVGASVSIKSATFSTVSTADVFVVTSNKRLALGNSSSGTNFWFPEGVVIGGTRDLNALSNWRSGAAGGIIIVGDTGTVYSSAVQVPFSISDFANRTSVSGTTQNMNAVKAISNGTSGTAWAVGNGGVIIKTINGGTTWATQTSGTTQNLNALVVISTTEVYVVGNNNTVLRTLDGGTTWANFATTGNGLTGSNNWRAIASFGATSNQLLLVGDAGATALYTKTPVLTSSPGSQTTCATESVTFSAAAAGEGTLSYQWRKNSVNISGATSATYFIFSPVVADAGQYSVVVTNANGSVTSNNAELIVNASTVITAQPQAAATLPVCTGANFFRSVGATGSGTLTYQWRRDGTPIVGQTLNSISLSATASTIGSYDCVVTGTCGTVTTNPFLVSLLVPPTITTQPAATAQFCSGGNVQISVAASSTEPISYLWRRVGSVTNFGTTPSILVTSANTYYCLVTNSCGTTQSANCVVSQGANTAITTQPSNATGCLGTPASFTVAATGTNLTYQWRKGTVNIAGATSATYTIPSVAATDGGFYNVIVSGCTSVTSNNAGLTLASGSIFVPFAGSPKCLGDIFNVQVLGAASGSTYQWRRNGVVVPGATTFSYNTGTITTLGDILFECVVTNAECGSVTLSATVNVVPAPAITAQPTALAVEVGQSATFSVTATGTMLTYQWRKSGFNIPGANASTYTIPAVTMADAAGYSVAVGGLCISSPIISGSALLTVNPTTRIEQSVSVLGFSFYPNPVEDVLRLQGPEVLSKATVVSVVDVIGNEVLRNRFEQGTPFGLHLLDLSQLSQGLYLLRIESGSETGYERLLKR
jgi:hypothetical protein